MNIDIPVTKSIVKTMVINFRVDENKLGYSEVVYDLLAMNGKKVGEFRIDDDDFPDEVKETLLSLKYELDEAARDPINRELRLLEASNDNS